MKLSNLLTLLLLALSATITSACSSESSSAEIEALAYRSTESGRWGIVSMDGEVIVRDYFKNEPTVAMDGRYFVKNDEGLWEMYDLSAQPQKKGGKYVYTSGFYHGRALVAERNQGISLIDTEGKVLKRLDRIANKSVEEIASFDQGYAIFLTTDSLYGAIDENGTCVVQPSYCYLVADEGNFVGIPKQYRKVILSDDSLRKYALDLLDKSGRMLHQFQSSEFEELTTGNDKFAIATKQKDKESWTFYNFKGDVLFRCPENVKNITAIKGNNFIYSNRKGFGLMNLNGEILIPAQYADLEFDGDYLIATIESNVERNSIWLNQYGQKVGSEAFESIYKASDFDNEHAVVRVNEMGYSLVDLKGNPLKHQPDMVEVGWKKGDDFIQSDIIDLNELLNQLKFSPQGVDGLSFRSSAEAGAKHWAEVSGEIEDEEALEMLPALLSHRADLTYTLNVMGIQTELYVEYNQLMSRHKAGKNGLFPTGELDYEAEREEMMSHNFVWNDTYPNSFAMKIANKGKMHGRLRPLFNAIVARLQQTGSLMKGNNGAKIFKLKDGHHAIVALEPHSVFVIWGKIEGIEDYDIEIFKNYKEDLNITSEETSEDMTDGLSDQMMMEGKSWEDRPMSLKDIISTLRNE